MKKILLVAVISVFGLTLMNAQDTQFGVKAGLNLALIRGDNSNNVDAVTSFNFGVVAEIPITERFSFQPKAMYSGEGFSVNDNTHELNYINVPLMAKYYIIRGFSVEAGPQVGFLISAKNEGTDVKDFYKSIDFGVNLGLGYKLDNGLNFAVRYNLGLSNIHDGPGTNCGVPVKNYNSVFQVSVGYLFF